MTKSFVFAEVKSAPSDNPNGEFEIIMSTDSVDRDGERIAAGAFMPLPASIPVLAHHNLADPVGRAVPSYDTRGRLVGKGVFASTARAQEIRQLVSDGVIGHTSVGFISAVREKSKSGPVVVRSAELLEVSFVSVPSNRDAAVLSVKAHDSSADALMIKARFDLLLAQLAITDAKSFLARQPREQGKARREAERFLASLTEDTKSVDPEQVTFNGRPITHQLFTRKGL